MLRGIILQSMVFILSVRVFGLPYTFIHKDSIQHPKRIIRSCCSFGSEMKVSGLPFLKVSQITSMEQMGSHTYLGSKLEQNGIIYTNKAGFIDMGHLRDVADWTAFLYQQISNSKNINDTIGKLGHEGGKKILEFNLPECISEEDKILLAGKIAYDISVWHEIATWYGTSSVPLLGESFSSFSVEDSYSNLLGAILGMKALSSDLPYEEAMTSLIKMTLDSFGASLTKEETIKAIESVDGVWWSKEYSLPSKKVTIERELTVYPVLTPRLLPNLMNDSIRYSYQLNVPLHSSSGIDLTEWYQLKILINYKFPFRELFPERKQRFVTEEDFTILVVQIKREMIEEGKIYTQADNSKSH